MGGERSVSDGPEARSHRSALKLRKKVMMEEVSRVKKKFEARGKAVVGGME
jgi:hypothetical protein